MRTLKRSNALLSLAFALLASPLAGCAGTEHVPISGDVDDAKIVGVTTRSGREVHFTKAGARWRRDTLYAADTAERIAIPVDSIKSVTVETTSLGRTALLIVVIAGVITAAGAVAISSIHLAPPV